MNDLVGGSSRPRTLPDIQEHFRRKGYDVIGDAVFEGELLIGVLQQNVHGYGLFTFEELGFEQQINHATAVAKEYGLPVQNAQRVIYVDGR